MLQIFGIVKMDVQYISTWHDLVKRFEIILIHFQIKIIFLFFLDDFDVKKFPKKY